MVPPLNQHVFISAQNSLPITVHLPESSAVALGFPNLEQVESLQSVAHLFGSSKPRRGIYLLHFKSGLWYVGQAIDVVRRFSQHRRNHTDIIAFSFIPVPIENLDIIEKTLIYKAELLRLKITNAVHVTSVVGDTDLDLVVSRNDQESWLNNLSYFDGKRRNDSKIVLPEAQQVRFSKHFAKIENHVLFPSVLPLLQRYVGRCLPAPRQTEYSFWSVSCMPTTNSGTWPRLFTVNAGMMELFVVGWVKHSSDQVWAFVTVAEDVLFQTWDSIEGLEEAFPFIEFERRGYRDAGQHQVTLQVYGTAEIMTLLKNDTICKAAAIVALRVMRKRATIYAKFHCPQLATCALLK